MTFNAQEFEDIAKRWDGVSNGHKNLTFEAAKSDMEKLLAEVRSIGRLKAKISELESHIKKRNNDMQSFAAEVARLANQKYADYLELGKS